MKISILGAGFIGGRLLKSCLCKGYTVSVLDHKPCPHELKGMVAWRTGYLNDAGDVLETIRNADVVYHLISSTVPGDDVDENEEIMKNVSQTISLLKLCVQQKVKKIIFISSSSIYGLQDRLPINEQASTDPISSHGIHKLTIEKYLLFYKYQFGLDCKIMRLSNPYGVGQNIFGRQGILAISIGKIISDKAIVIHGDGSAIRDFIHIDDVINACHLLVDSNSDEVIFNIGSGMGLTIQQMLQDLQKVTKKHIAIEYMKGRTNDISASVLDISKANEILGFNVNTIFLDGLMKTLIGYAESYPEISSYFKIDKF